MPGPVTFADLARQGTLLLVWCRRGHRAERDAGEFPLRESTPVPGIDRRFRCSAYDARNTPVDQPVMTLTDPRKKGVRGAYL